VSKGFVRSKADKLMLVPPDGVAPLD